MEIIKIERGLPKINEEKHLNLLKEGWKQLKEPKTISGQIILSIPFMIINFLIGSIIVGLVAPNMELSFEISTLSDLFIFISTPLLLTISLVIIHELLHLSFIPNFIKSKKTYMGFTWFGAYVITEEILSKGRACFIFMAPFIFISIIFNFLIGIIGTYSIPILFFITLNSIGSSLDLLGLTLILFQVPKGAKVMSNGFYTYFK